jgi:2-alkenal reductase
MNRTVIGFGIGFLIVLLLGGNLAFMSLGTNDAEASVMPATMPIATPIAPTEAFLTEDSPPSPAAAELLAVAAAEEQVLIRLYERVSASVVNISVVTRRGAGTGSGFVLDTEGHILTNNHVIEGAAQILVRFADDTIVEAELIGADPDSDLAVIKVELPASQLKPVELGDSDVLRVGQRAVALGNPFGFEQTMTTGIISALGRVVPQRNGYSLPALIQTDAAINPGNSGGPLLDSQGRVIGVNTLIFSSSGSSAGVGFAVPVNTVKRVIPALLERGSYADPWLGISGLSINAFVAEALDLSTERGVLLQVVVDGGPADLAGLRADDEEVVFDGVPLAAGGDIILFIDGIPIGDMDDLVTELSRKLVDETVTVTILRDGAMQDVSVTLEERPGQ